MNRLLNLLPLILILTGCMSPHPYSKSIGIEGATATVKLISTKNAKPEGSGALVFGKVEIKGPKKIKFANLNCLIIVSDGYKSEGIYIDSLASVVTNEFPGENGAVAVNVYWFLPGFSSNNLEMDTITIQKSEDEMLCISYL